MTFSYKHNHAYGQYKLYHKMIVDSLIFTPNDIPSMRIVHDRIDDIIVTP